MGAFRDEDESKWKLRIEDLKRGVIFDDWCDFLINGSGILHNWKWPEIPGLRSFKGALLHSAAWPEGYDLKNKTVAVLGCGSSGVQIVPTIQPDVKHLVTFIRSPTWITAGYAQNKAGPGGANFSFSDAQKREFRQNPAEYLAYRKEVESELNMRFKLIIKDSAEQAEARQYSINEMNTKLGHDARLIKHIIPNFAVGCRRPTPGNGYLEALTQSNVRVLTDNIGKFVEDGIVHTTGEVFNVDVFICATGFDISFCPRFPLRGRKGISLADQWKEKPEAYLSVATENFPNYFSK
jgi:cation diffusion facilitator CzcD-associated flavoprotein CzcO